MLLVCNAGMSMHEAFSRKLLGKAGIFSQTTIYNIYIYIIRNHEHGATTKTTKTTRAWYFAPGCDARGAKQSA